MNFKKSVFLSQQIAMVMLIAFTTTIHLNGGATVASRETWQTWV